MNKKVIHSVVEHVVINRAHRIALETDTMHISYEELNTQSNRLAHLLAERNIQKGKVAAVFFENIPIQLTSLLAVFKSGATYLPLDQKYKQNHWEVLYGNIQPEVVLLSQENFKALKEYATLFDYVIPQAIIVSMDAEKNLEFSIYEYQNEAYTKVEINDTLSTENPELVVDGEDDNYIFFTSGSSGKPKAVLGRHKSLSHFVHWESKELGITENDRIGQLTSFSFDASLRDVFVALMNGATICIPPAAVKEDMTQLATWLRDQKITLLHTIPTLFRLLSTAFSTSDKPSVTGFPELKHLLLAGEKLYNKDILNWRNTYGNNTSIINLYGATESTLVKTFYRIENELEGKPADVLCVGKAISNTVVLILNTDNELCQINEEGSIYIKTPFLSKGYYGDREQTAEKFIQNPLNTQEDIIYKTGDYGKYNSDRNIIVLGRKDGLVKLNGVRTDLNTIEQTILELEEVSMIKCMLHQSEQMDSMLVCFYTSETLSEEMVRAHCIKYLSHYEMPAFIVRLDQFPINANGKTDTIALRQKMIQSVLGTQSFQAPTNEIEEQLQSIWEEILEVERVGVQDNFFALGGQSLKMIRLINRIQKDFSVRIGTGEFYEHTTIEQLARLLLSKEQKTIDRIRPIETSEKGYGISNEQLRIWIASQSDEGSVAHNMSYTYAINGNLDVAIFKKALGEVIQRHEALRTFFSTNEEGETIMFIRPDMSVDTVLTFVPEDSARTEVEIENWLNTFATFRFDLENPPLFKVLLIQKSENEFVLSSLMHHILGDFSSDEVIIEEIAHLYSHYKNNTPLQLPALKVQYKDYASWIKNKLAQDGFKEEKIFWKTHLKGLRRKSKWYGAAISEDFEGANIIEFFTEEIYDNIQNYLSENKRGLMGLMAAALGVLIHKKSGEEDVLIGVPISLKNHPDLAGQVGLYLNLLPLRVKTNTFDQIGKILKDTATNQNKTMDAAFYPFDTIVEEFDQENHSNLIDQIDVYLNIINHRDLKNSDAAFGDLTFEMQSKIVEKSKFPICFYINQFEDGISYRIEYQTKLFSGKEIAKLAQRFCKCVELLLKNPDKKINSIDLVDKKSIPLFQLK